MRVRQKSSAFESTVSRSTGASRCALSKKTSFSRAVDPSRHLLLRYSHGLGANFLADNGHCFWYLRRLFNVSGIVRTRTW